MTACNDDCLARSIFRDDECADSFLPCCLPLYSPPNYIYPHSNKRLSRDCAVIIMAAAGAVRGVSPRVVGWRRHLLTCRSHEGTPRYEETKADN